MRRNVFGCLLVLCIGLVGNCWEEGPTTNSENPTSVPSEVAKTGVSATATTPLDAPVKPYLNMEMAQKVLDCAIAYAGEVKAPGGSIAIVDDGGHLILLHRMDGTMPATPPIATGKARTAALFRMPTLKFEDITRGGRVSMLKIDGFMPMQGGIPIKIDGQVVGAIGVSGASSAAQDEEIAIAGADVYNKSNMENAKLGSGKKASAK